MSDLPDRPPPRRSVAEQLQQWVHWVGAGRLVAGALAVLAVLAAGYWLVRPPAATTESTLPYAAGAGGTSAPTTAVTGGTAQSPTSSPPVAGTTEPLAMVVVHVAGAVQAPGVYRLAEGSRVVDAVAAAGGMTGAADVDVVNLAALLRDGERVYVPEVGETVPVVVAGAGGGGGGEGGGDTAVAAGPVNLNTATADELDGLPGVGPATAAAIIAHRDAHGPFASVDQLADVRGIGPAKLEALRGLVTV